ncbi:hypothetical protein CEXT_412571 [Caerostris extrusa]|uniref:Uncharacterized protein n=1 Tax=Caerostris extrusa TaxID=172846 RepID=A0AAV4SQY7_CAEEX|nr:hypothetical protein CEXT_412571 [Caerostris extrusa]
MKGRPLCIHCSPVEGESWVDVHPLGHLRVCLAGHHPPAVVELGDSRLRDVHQENVYLPFLSRSPLTRTLKAETCA